MDGPLDELKQNDLLFCAYSNLITMGLITTQLKPKWLVSACKATLLLLFACICQPKNVFGQFVTAVLHAKAIICSVKVQTENSTFSLPSDICTWPNDLRLSLEAREAKRLKKQEKTKSVFSNLTTQAKPSELHTGFKTNRIIRSSHYFLVLKIFKENNKLDHSPCSFTRSYL